jgi:hypothetical protein
LKLINEEKFRVMMKYSVFLILLFVIALSISNWILSFRVGESFNPYKDVINYQIDIPSTKILFGSERQLYFAYHYVVSPLASLNYYITNEDRGPKWYGLATFNYFGRWLKKLGFKFEYELPHYRKRLKPPEGGQLATYLSGAFLDFGYLGIIFYPFLLIFLSSHVFFLYLKVPTLNKLVILSFLYLIIEFSIFINPFRWMTFFIAILIAIMLFKFLDF